MKTTSALVPFFLASACGLTGCNYDFSFTERPTRPINERLLGPEARLLVKATDQPTRSG